MDWLFQCCEAKLPVGRGQNQGAVFWWDPQGSDETDLKTLFVSLGLISGFFFKIVVGKGHRVSVNGTSLGWGEWLVAKPNSQPRGFLAPKILSYCTQNGIVIRYKPKLYFLLFSNYTGLWELYAAWNLIILQNAVLYNLLLLHCVDEEKKILFWSELGRKAQLSLESVVLFSSRN